MADMRIDQKNLTQLFSDMQKRKFIIPDYQRPYNWDIEKCEILWGDLKDNFLSSPDKDYFLGTIVTYKNGSNLEVIDGQQRLTTFSLLLRAFYTKLEAMQPTPDVKGLKRQIGACLWDVDDISEEVKDKRQTRIDTKVATEKDKGTFSYIMETGDSKEQKNNYSNNYEFFQNECNKFAVENPMMWYHFCSYILKKCVLLPIECADEEVALTIFSTLNNRGMPLSDADIFKSELYKVCKTETEKADFIAKWDALTEVCDATKDKKGNYEFTIDDIFMYYMQVLRGRENNKDTTNIGLRAYYLKKGGNHRLMQPGLIDEILELAEFWRSAYGFSGKYNMSDDVMKWLHCLWSFPNTIWVYPVSAYFLTNKDMRDDWESETTQEQLSKFIKKLCAFVYAKYIYKPSLSQIKGDIYTLDAEICQNASLATMDNSFVTDSTKTELDKFIVTKKFVRGILTIDAYLNPNQKELLKNPDKLEIEHILPQKWQMANYNGWDKESAVECLEKFGNKVLFEKKLNIQAGNGYFAQKKVKYKDSKIANVQDLALLETNDWSKNELNQRDTDLKDRIIDFFKGIK